VEITMRFCFLYLFSILISFSSSAQWYETQGQAFVTNGNTQAARTLAMENALKKALLVAGASVSSVQQVVNGLLTQDDISIRASGSVNSFELVSETQQGRTITVQIRADIFPQTKQCFSADYRKSLLLTRSNLLYREQANIGGIYDIDTEVIRKLAAKINSEGHYLDAKLAIGKKSEFTRLNKTLQAEKVKNLTMSLSDITDTQYVMYSEIQDISFDREVTNGWQFWQEDIYQRHFNINIYIYNGNSGEQIFYRQYRNIAPWAYTRRAQISTSSHTFWASEYGNIIDQTLNTMISDIDESMMCQPTRGKIIRVTGNEIRFNLGKKHGVKVGDEFSLLHSNNYISDSGKIYAGYNVSNYKVRVTSVSQESAVAVTPDQELLGNIQISDIAVRY